MSIVLQIHSRNQISIFYIDILKYKEQRRAFPILNNSEIKLNNKTFFFIKSWFQNGVKSVGDFLQDSGFFNTRDAFAPMSHSPHL